MCSNLDSVLLLIGKPGQGRSATGNSILGNDSFESASAMNDVTSRWDFDFAAVQGRIIKVVDTPGFRDLSGNSSTLNETFTKSLKCAFATHSKGYNALLIVVRFGTRVTEEELNIVKLLKAEFGETFVKEFCIIVMTFGDLFQQEPGIENMSFPQWCEQQKGPFQQLLKECSGRIVLFDNKTKNSSLKKKQVECLFAMVDQLRGTTWSQVLHFMFPDLASKSASKSGATGGYLHHSSGGNQFPGPNSLEEAYKEMSFISKELKMYEHSIEDETERFEKLIMRTETLINSLQNLVGSAQQVHSLLKIVIQTKRTISNNIKVNVVLKPLRDDYRLKAATKKIKFLEERKRIQKRYTSLIAECPNDTRRQVELSMESEVKLDQLREEFESERKAAVDDFINIIREKRQEKMKECEDFKSAENLEEELRRSRTEFFKSVLHTIFDLAMLSFKFVFSKVFRF